MLGYSRGQFHKIKIEYGNCYSDWYCYWTLLYILVIRSDYVFEQLDPLRELRIQQGIDDDVDLLTVLLTADGLQLSKIKQDESQIEGAALYWLYENSICQTVQDLEKDEIREMFQKSLMPFEKMRTTEDYRGDVDDLIRRIVFAFYGINCIEWIPEVIIDLAPLLLDDNNHSLSSHIFITKVIESYNQFMTLSPNLKLPVNPVITYFRIVWTPASIIFASPVSAVIWSFI